MAYVAATSGESPRKRSRLVALVAVAALTAGGVFYGPSLYSRLTGSSGDRSEVARTGEREVTPANPGSTGAVQPPAPEVASSTAASAGSTASTGKTGDDKASSTTAPRTGDQTRITREPSKTVTDEPEFPDLVAGAVETTPAPIEPVQRGESGFPDLQGHEFQWASQDQLELIWRGAEVPFEAIQAPAKTLMPRVGIVRVLTTSGDVFDGRLYAVGQNRVWVDAEPGRIGLDGERVEKIEVLGQVAAGVAPGGEAKELTGKKRVRVRVAGGMLYGSVLKSEGEDVILALDDGGRVRVKASDIEDLGSGRAVVVRR